MRYGLISDIHGNLEAFQAVLSTISKENIGEYLCIGDVVGYGADPKECVKLVKSLNPGALVAGNHEWGVLGITGIEYFNEIAKEAILWTRGVLSEEELDFLKAFKLVYENGPLTLVHGTLESPKEFYYILNTYDAYSTFRLMKAALCFIGHSHAAGIFLYSDDTVSYIRDPKIKIESGKKYIVNVGSVGQPRDLDPRASCAIYDDEEGTIEIRRVEYDIKKAKEKILEAGLPKRLAYRLEEGT